MRLATRLSSGLALTVTVCWALALALSGSTDTLLFLAPALLIVAPLVAGRYPGEELIAKLVAERSQRPRRPAAVLAPSPRSVVASSSPRGTGLLAFSRAERPPPFGLLPQT
ncbi:MAG TPA: hypothetical protein VH042_10955 [Solirubrobacterales bacterium]|jgi:hypothetical protein|nr:hypothetical protein [Solirubrobacterales bacterium]